VASTVTCSGTSGGTESIEFSISGTYMCRLCTALSASSAQH
jgi:hypothetical protein